MKRYKPYKFEEVVNGFGESVKKEKQYYLDGKLVTITRVDGDRVYIKDVKFPGRPEVWVKMKDLKEV